MQIASKCKPARAVRAKNKRHGKNLANIRSTTQACILKSLTVFIRSGLSHMKKCSGPFSTSEYFLVSCLQTYFPLVINAVLSSWFL